MIAFGKHLAIQFFALRILIPLRHETEHIGIILCKRLITGGNIHACESLNVWFQDSKSQTEFVL